MSDLHQAISFAAGLYRERARVLRAGYVQRDPVALLALAPGRADPYAIYDRIRARGTLVPTRVGDWATPSHRVCSAVLRDRRFGVRLDDGPLAADEIDMSLLTMNPPDHTRLRRLIQPAFSPKIVAGYAGRIERTVTGLLDAAGEEFDLISDFAAVLPIAVITDLLGIPDADSAYFARIGAIIGSAIGGIRSLRHARALQESADALERLFADLFELRRREPRDDIVSRIVAAEGTQIMPSEMQAMCALLLVAGFETTVNAIGNGVLALLAHPGQWQALCADPAGLAPRAVSEALRFDPPVQLTERLALEPVELEGQEISRGQSVLPLIGAANRDPEAFDHPDTFDLHRDGTTDNLAFSGGIHYCAGQPLARLELTIALQLLAERMPGLARAGKVERRNSNVIRGPIRVPVTAGPRRTAASLAAG
jgi:P450-derived glycosyltransferase activator